MAEVCSLDIGLPEDIGGILNPFHVEFKKQRDPTSQIPPLHANAASLPGPAWAISFEP